MFNDFTRECLESQHIDDDIEQRLLTRPISNDPVDNHSRLNSTESIENDTSTGINAPNKYSLTKPDNDVLQKQCHASFATPIDRVIMKQGDLTVRKGKYSNV
jgi:hypothetical protein